MNAIFVVNKFVYLLLAEAFHSFLVPDHIHIRSSADVGGGERMEHSYAIAPGQ